MLRKLQKLVYHPTVPGRAAQAERTECATTYPTPSQPKGHWETKCEAACWPVSRNPITGQIEYVCSPLPNCVTYWVPG